MPTRVVFLVLFGVLNSQTGCLANVFPRGGTCINNLLSSNFNQIMLLVKDVYQPVHASAASL